MLFNVISIQYLRGGMKVSAENLVQLKLVRNREVSSNSCVKFDFADGRVKG